MANPPIATRIIVTVELVDGEYRVAAYQPPQGDWRQVGGPVSYSEYKSASAMAASFMLAFEGFTATSFEALTIADCGKKRK